MPNKEHSTILNTLSSTITKAVGAVPDGTTSVEADPAELLGWLIADRDLAWAEVKRLRNVWLTDTTQLTEELAALWDGLERIRARFAGVSDDGADCVLACLDDLMDRGLITVETPDGWATVQPVNGVPEHDAEADAEADALREALTGAVGILTTVLGGFYEPGCPGRPSHRTGWVDDVTLNVWLAQLDGYKRALAVPVTTTNGTGE